LQNSNSSKKILFCQKNGMFKFFNRNIAIQWFIFFGLLLFSIYTIFDKAVVVYEDNATLLYEYFFHFYSLHPLFVKSIITVMLMLQVSLIQLFFIKSEVFTLKNSLFPSCFYLSILLLTKTFEHISPIFFTILFYTIVISINYSTSSVRLKNHVFWSGILIALATCFDKSSIVLFAMVVSTLFINQYFKIKEIAILVFGFLLVYLYYFAFIFLSDNLHEWLLFEGVRILGGWDTDILFQPEAIISLSGLFVLYNYYMIRTKLISDSKVVVVRKKIFTLNIWSLLMIACIFISNSSYPYVLGYLFVPISAYLAILSQEKNPFFMNEIITIATLFLLWL